MLTDVSNGARTPPDGIVIISRPRELNGDPVGDDVQLYMTTRQAAAARWCFAPFLLVPVLLTMHLARYGFAYRHRRPLDFNDTYAVAEACLLVGTVVLVFVGMIVRWRIAAAVDGQVYIAEGD